MKEMHPAGFTWKGQLLKFILALCLIGMLELNKVESGVFCLFVCLFVCFTINGYDLELGHKDTEDWALQFPLFQ